MNPEQELLDWEPEFLKRIMNRPDKEELKKEFEPGVQQLSRTELEKAAEYLELWKQGKTAGEKFYFGQKITEIVLQKKL